MDKEIMPIEFRIGVEIVKFMMGKGVLIPRPTELERDIKQLLNEHDLLVLAAKEREWKKEEAGWLDKMLIQFKFGDLYRLEVTFEQHIASLRAGKEEG